MASGGGLPKARRDHPVLAPVVTAAAGAAVTPPCTAVATLTAEAAPCATATEAAARTPAVAPSKTTAGRQHGRRSQSSRRRARDPDRVR